MVKKLVKGCLIVALAGLLSTPSYAVDIKANVNGRVRTWLANVAEKDGPTKMDMQSDGRIGADLSATAGEWTVTAFSNLDVTETSIDVRDQYIVLDNKSLAIKAGRFNPFGVTIGGWDWVGGYLTNTSVNKSYFPGENTPIERDEYISVKLNDLGLSVIFGANHFDGTTMGDDYNRTTIAASYSNQFGPLDLIAQFGNSSEAIDEKDAQALKGGDHDGATYSSIAFGVEYKFDEKMAASVAFENDSRSSGISGADDVTNTILEVYFDMALTEKSGVSVGYGQRSKDDGSSNKTEETAINFGFIQKLAIADVYAAYYIASEKDDDTSTDNNTQSIAVGVNVNF